jgi:hypothetical protein
MPPKLATPGLSLPSNKSGMLRLEMQLLKALVRIFFARIDNIDLAHDMWLQLI